MYNINKNIYRQKGSLYKELKFITNNTSTSNLISIKEINKGLFLTEERKPVNGIYFILEGKAKVFNTVTDQKIQILRLATKGDIIGLSSLNSAHYWSSAVVVERVKAYFINLKNLKFILGSNSKLSFLLVNSLAWRLQHYEVRQKHLSLFPASERVIEALLLIAYKFGKATDQGLEVSTCTSRRDIASFANTSSEKAIRTLSNLKSKKYIEVKGKNIIIKDKEGLINMLCKYFGTNDEPTDFNLDSPNFI